MLDWSALGASHAAVIVEGPLSHMQITELRIDANLGYVDSRADASVVMINVVSNAQVSGDFNVVLVTSIEGRQTPPWSTWPISPEIRNVPCIEKFLHEGALSRMELYAALRCGYAGVPPARDGRRPSLANNLTGVQVLSQCLTPKSLFQGSAVLLTQVSALPLLSWS